MRAPSLGRLVSSPYPMSPRDIAKISHDQHLLHFNCESSFQPSSGNSFLFNNWEETKWLQHSHDAPESEQTSHILSITRVEQRKLKVTLLSFPVLFVIKVASIKSWILQQKYGHKLQNRCVECSHFLTTPQSSPHPRRGGSLEYFFVQLKKKKKCRRKIKKKNDESALHFSVPAGSPPCNCWSPARCSVGSGETTDWATATHFFHQARRFHYTGDKLHVVVHWWKQMCISKTILKSFLFFFVQLQFQLKTFFFFSPPSSGHPRPVAQSSSWLGPWEDGRHTDGAILDGSEENGWVIMVGAGSCRSLLLPRFRNAVSHHCRTLFVSSTWTTGPFPVIKQEQLSPHSLSQADMSSQQAPHDGATGRGRQPPLFDAANVFCVGHYGYQAELSAIVLKMFTFQLGPQWSDPRTNRRMYSSNADET